MFPSLKSVYFIEYSVASTLASRLLLGVKAFLIKRCPDADRVSADRSGFALVEGHEMVARV
jgi:hypothetical protein